MKRIAYVCFAGTILAGMLTMQAAAQSEPLGDYARAVRKEKKQEKLESAKRFDNDNLPKNDTLSVVGNATDEAAGSSSDAAAQAAQAQPGDDSAKKAEVTPGESAEARQKVYDEWKTKIAAQRERVDLLSREMDVLQREYRLRAAAFYADAGNRLRNAGSWDKEDSHYKLELAEKQKALNTAKEQLDNLQEQARKSGAPSSVRE